MADLQPVETSLLSISFIFIDLGDSYNHFILIFININIFCLLSSQIFLFCDPVELYSEKKSYIKLLSNNLCNLMTNFPQIWPKEKARHYNDYMFLVLLEDERTIFHKIVSLRLLVFKDI